MILLDRLNSGLNEADRRINGSPLLCVQLTSGYINVYTAIGLISCEFHQLVYYRPYTKDGAIKSLNPIYSNDPFISRVLPKSITPPHTALSLKKHLCKIEGVAGSNAILFEALSDDAAIPDSTRLKLRGHLGLGVLSREPMALVVGAAEVEKRSSGPDPQAKELSENPDPHETHYIYYRVYDEDGEVNSKTTFDRNDTSLGRVDTLSVAPPYTVASLKSRIAKAEDIVDRAIQLFEDTDGETLMKDADRASFLAETFPGCLEDDPLAFIYGPKIPGQGSMTRPIRANIDCSPNPQSISTWHAHYVGEVLHTDGVKVTKTYIMPGGPTGSWNGYMAINSAGKLAFVIAANPFRKSRYYSVGFTSIAVMKLRLQRSTFNAND
ncbi:uncharacterized protein LACBIDRAFT_300531 [Laccaria bicolor S238N-H82]|uniref:Predicted protein n=1 Tax=Laccaria bicolor (strain S238N-H82 / ATCC MYA-4686) TaxID=486041 RepID=B0DGZ3_LACBS|nr:uncharacterized protein LACBIDRAFT_300531 [Laccaria bicolor S238N-H82]EDR06356.1 predicted protein [Laccaria bicolor S238N-H82]|eukprot:XP_001883217.1 predicted protein [Laccaria bicolor S238N-H82]